MKVQTIGFATIGQTPRDDLVPYLMERLRPDLQCVEGGVLDDLSPEEMQRLDHGDQGLHMVTRLRNGGSARLAFAEALPRMQRVVDRLVDDGADLVVILCGADWSAVHAPIPVINPGKLFPRMIQGIASGSRLGVIKPSAGQVERTIRQYQDDLGLEVEVTSAFPYDDSALGAMRTAAQDLKNRDIDMVWMTCVGMTDEMKRVVQNELGRPVVLARSILARVMGELTA